MDSHWVSHPLPHLSFSHSSTGWRESDRHTSPVPQEKERRNGSGRDASRPAPAQPTRVRLGSMVSLASTLLAASTAPYLAADGADVSHTRLPPRHVHGGYNQVEPPEVVAVLRPDEEKATCHRDRVRVLDVCGEVGLMELDTGLRLAASAPRVVAQLPCTVLSRRRVTARECATSMAPPVHPRRIGGGARTQRSTAWPLPPHDSHLEVRRPGLWPLLDTPICKSS